MKPDPDVPPQDLEAERAVIASILLQNSAYDEVVQSIRAPSYFYADAHRRMFASIKAMYERSPSGIDALTLRAEIEKAGDLDAVGGVPYLLKVLETVPHAAHADYYAKIVLARYIEREAIEASSETIRDIRHSGDEVFDIIGRAEKRFFDLAENSGGSDRIEIADILDDTFERLFERMGKEGSISGTASGISGLDDLLSGFQPSELIILAARPAMGKTALVCNFALTIAKQGKGVLLFSLEQSKLELAERLLCIQTKVDGHKLRQGTLDWCDQQALTQGRTDLGELPIYLDDLAGQTMTRISAVSRRVMRTKGIGVVIIDYLQLIEAEDRNLPREQQISSITRRLKFLAKDLNVPVIALGQLNRGVEAREDKKPRLSDLRESGAIEQDADIVMFLHRPDAYEPNDRPGEADLIVAKNRSGPTGTAHLVWLRSSLKFGDKAENFIPAGSF